MTAVGETLLEVQAALLARVGHPVAVDAPGGDFWSRCGPGREAAAQFASEALDTWHARTLAAGGSRGTKQYRALNQSVSAQVEALMQDRARLVARTQQLRTPAARIGAADAEPATADADIFDDGDFYQGVLRELIERKVDSAGAVGGDQLALGQKWVELNRMRTKTKRAVDTKASKGRKIRYKTMDKLVNFMAPDDTVHPSTDQAKSDLFGSLFQDA